MAKANTQADECQPSAETPSSSAASSMESNPPHEGRGPTHSPPEGRGPEAVSVVVAVVAAALTAVGLLTIIFGVHLTPSNTAILAGAVVMALACLLWIVAVLTMLVGVLKKLITLWRTSRRAASQRKLQ